MTTPADWSDEYKALVRRQFAEQNLADADLAKLKHICLSKGLDPLSGDVHCIKRGGKVSIELSVHGLLKLCASQMAGSETLWFDSDGNAFPVWLTQAKPAACQFKLWRRGCSQPFVASAVFADYDTGKAMWKSMPSRMIEKVATAQCCRLGFADLVGGLYSPEEMPEADEQPEQPVSAPADSSSSNSKKTASKRKQRPNPLPPPIRLKATLSPNAKPFSSASCRPTPKRTEPCATPGWRRCVTALRPPEPLRF